ncbi:MAG: hypothetical protein ACYCQK_01940 [Acidiferrobacteraceae bacterium]
MNDAVYVRWLDSCVQHGQVDTDDLPWPSTLETVGWLSFEGPSHIVVSRDHSPDPDSYSWRSSVAIPRAHVLHMERLAGTPPASEGER